MKRAIIVFVLISLHICGCSSKSKDASQIEATIRRYDQLLIEGYKTLNMNPLQEVATAGQATKDYYYMAALGEAHVRMLAELKEIRFYPAEFPKGGEAVIKTRETWDYTYNDIKSGEKKYEEKGFVYLLSYELKKEGARWLITSVTAVKGGTDKKETAPPPRHMQAPALTGAAKHP